MMEAAMGFPYSLARQGLLSSEDIAFVTSVADPGCLYRISDPQHCFYKRPIFIL
jgi:hypothetical protein